MKQNRRAGGPEHFPSWVATSHQIELGKGKELFFNGFSSIRDWAYLDKSTQYLRI